MELAGKKKTALCKELGIIIPGRGESFGRGHSHVTENGCVDRLTTRMLRALDILWNPHAEKASARPRSRERGAWLQGSVAGAKAPRPERWKGIRAAKV